jgi:conjugal transfer pilus assembly protein TraW
MHTLTAHLRLTAAASLVLTLWCASAVAQATSANRGATTARVDSGALGPTYDIAEPDMLEQMMRRLRNMERSGELQKRMEEGKAQALRSLQNPRPVPGLGRASVERSYLVDPSVSTDRDIRTPDGTLIAKAGTKVNPLEFVSMSRWLVFFDARDKRQVALAESLGKRYDWNIKPILVAGAPLDLGRAWKRQVYFDQGGYLVSRLGIQNVPALVTQDGAMLRIQELRP